MQWVWAFNINHKVVVGQIISSTKALVKYLLVHKNKGSPSEDPFSISSLSN